MAIIAQQAIEKALDEWAALLAKDAACGAKPMALVGLISGGDILAARLQKRLEAMGCNCRFGAIDITLYRDDFSMQGNKPALRSSYLPFSTDGMRLILVDDVMNTGRTVRAALNAIFDYGRPDVVELHCLVDRGGRELPIQPTYAAFDLTNEQAGDVRVLLTELHGEDSINY